MLVLITNSIYLPIRNKMKIAQFSTNDIQGGAAKASYRLFESLQSTSVTYFVKNKTLTNSNIITLEPTQSQNTSLEHKIHTFHINKNRANISNTLFSFTYNDIQLPNLMAYDIINLHWIDYFLSLNNLYELVLLNKPIVWTLHDMKPFTGGCHYSSGCEEYQKKCKACIQLKQDDFNLPKKILKLKKTIFRNANITLVTPSKWLKKEAKKSSLFKNKPIKVIPNAVNSNIFKAHKKKEAKKYFNINTNSIILGFGAASHTEQRKGFKELLKALETIKDDLNKLNVKALFFGTSQTDNFPIETINLGHIKDEDTLSKVYSACDIFVLPSKEDNLPNTILESLSCATPIIAFNVGGIKDIVSNKNGILVKKNDTKALSNAILSLIKNKKLRRKLGIQGQKLIQEEYQLQHQEKKYLKLYNKLHLQPNNKRNNKGHIKTNLKKFFNEITNYTIINNPENESITFSKNFNTFFNQIKKLDSTNKYVIYGNGTIGQTIQKLLSKNIVDYVDINDINHHPKNLITMQYDKILISVLGREKEILSYLTEELNINRDKIIIINI